jgi:excisionase family DNA binding protein
MEENGTVRQLRQDPDRLLTYSEFSEWAQVPERTVRKWVADGTGPRVMKLGRYRRIRVADALAWLETAYVDAA